MAVSTDRVMGGNGAYDAVFTDKKDNASMNQMDFMKLMLAQMQNQDFTNPMDNSQMVDQMATFSNMQMMQEMATTSKTGYAMSLVGKTVTASRFDVSGNLDTTTGMINKVSLVDNEYVLYVNDKRYTIDQIMSVESGTTSGSAINPKNFELKAEAVTRDSATLKWKVPTEDEMTAAGLRYTVYYTKESGFDTVEAVEKGTLVGSKEQSKITSTELKDLDPDTAYYANVVVTDAKGNKTVYKPTKFTTRL